MTNQIDLNSFSAKKYKNELYQLRLNSYLEKSEDFEESDFIESEQKYFNSCYNSVDQIFYNNSFVDWSELKDEIGTQEFYDMKPKPDTLTSKYITNNPNEEERLQKTFSLITAFLNKKEDIHSKKIEHPQFEPAIIEATSQLQKKKAELLKNPNEKIFSSDFGYYLFEKMFELYKDEKNHLANFSFLFHAMEKDFLVCSQAEFKEFLRDEKYNIEIEKIDQRQWHFDMNKNKKSKLYNVIKESLQKKHGLSTI